MSFGIPMIGRDEISIGQYTGKLDAYSSKYVHPDHNHELGHMSVPYEYEIIENPIASIQAESVTYKQGKYHVLCESGWHSAASLLLRT